MFKPVWSLHTLGEGSLPGRGCSSPSRSTTFAVEAGILQQGLNRTSFSDVIQGAQCFWWMLIRWSKMIQHDVWSKWFCQNLFRKLTKLSIWRCLNNVLPKNSTHRGWFCSQHLPTSYSSQLYERLGQHFQSVLQMERCARYPPAPQVIPILCSDQRYSVIWIDWALQHSSHNCQPQPFSFVEFWTAATHLGGFRVLSASAPVQNHQASHLAPQVLGSANQRASWAQQWPNGIPLASLPMDPWGATLQQCIRTPAHTSNGFATFPAFPRPTSRWDMPWPTLHTWPLNDLQNRFKKDDEGCTLW